MKEVNANMAGLQVAEQLLSQESSIIKDYLKKLKELQKLDSKKISKSLARERELLSAVDEIIKKYFIHMVGHAHIDAAWLWPRSQTVDVVYHTFSQALDLMETYADFTFSQSSAVYYQWMEEYYLEVFRKIKQRVKEGRWEIVGGQWIEPDNNIPCGESLVRQILYGKRYFKEKFGVEVRVAWNPDSFGFNWQLPQIYKKCGLEFFLTHKLTWQGSIFPYITFWWQSPDGSRILGTQTVGPYNQKVDLREMGRQLQIMKAQDGLNHLIYLYGQGDHGGGPTPEMVEIVRDLSGGRIAPFPRVEFSTARKYFDRIRSKKGDFPLIKDELYLGTHRGTYTSWARIKRKNRKAECWLMNAEKFSIFAERYGVSYPRQELTRAWKKLLFNQFHDILPGSSIPEVYRVAERDYEEIFSIVKKLLFQSLKRIGKNIDTCGEGSSILAFNPLSWKRDGLVKLELDSLKKDSVDILDPEGKIIPCQLVEEGGKEKIVFLAEDVPALGYKLYRVLPARGEGKLKGEVIARGNRLENQFYRVKVDSQSGHLVSIYDKTNQREIIDTSGKGNLFQIYEDRTKRETAWNIDPRILKGTGKPVELDKAIEVKMRERGPVRGTIRIRYLYHQEGRDDSTFTQDIILYSGIPYLEFKTYIDWHIEYRLLKISFPLNLSHDYATYEIPYGYIQRRDPTSSRASPMEKQKKEVSAQRWIDYTNKEGDYGVSLLNDGKYGFDVRKNIMRLTALRSPSSPPSPHYPSKVKTVDQGKHEFNYALYPHPGDWRQAGVVRKGYEFNYPLLIQREPSHKGNLPSEHSFLEVDPENMILTVIKKAEDSRAVILRLYETMGKDDTQARIIFSEPVVKAWEADMLENSLFGKSLPIEGGVIKISLGHHEIKTIKLIKAVEVA